MQVKSEVNIFNYINLTILFLFYPDLYKEAWRNQTQWFYNKNNEVSENYFNVLVSKYSEDNEILDELLSLISPPVHKIQNPNLKKRNIDGKSYFGDEIRTQRYLSLYFTHNFSENRIPDIVLDSAFDKWIKETNNELQKKYIKDFLKEYNSKLVDIFLYLNINYNKEFNDLYKTIIILFSEESVNFGVMNFNNIINNIYAIVYKLNNGHDDKLIDKIITEASSIAFAINMYNKFTEYDIVIDATRKENLINIFSRKISNNIENSLNSLNLFVYKKYLDLWLREDNYVDIYLLTKNEYEKLRNKVQLLMPIIYQKTKYFWFFLGEDLIDNIIKYNNELKSDTLKNQYQQNIISYMIMWGRENIELMINYILNNNRKQENYSNIEKLNQLMNKLEKNIFTEVEMIQNLRLVVADISVKYPYKFKNKRGNDILIFSEKNEEYFFTVKDINSIAELGGAVRVAMDNSQTYILKERKFYLYVIVNIGNIKSQTEDKLRISKNLQKYNIKYCVESIENLKQNY